MGAPVPWLDDDEQRAWRAFLSMQSHLFRHLERQLQTGSELSAPDFEVLVNLSEAEDGELRAFELADRLTWERSRLSHQLSRMEKRGLVERRTCPTDRRGAHVAITASGRSAIEAAAPGHVAELRRILLGPLGRERFLALGELSRTVDAAIAAAEADDAATRSA